MTFTDKNELIRILEFCESGCEHCKHADARCRCEYGSAYETACSVICDAPEVDAEPVKHGEWIKINAYALHKCSVCDGESYVPTCMGEPIYAFCPHCGAKMDSKGDAE